MTINPCYIAAGSTARLDKTVHVRRTIFPIEGELTDTRFDTRTPIAEGELGFGVVDDGYQLYCAVLSEPDGNYFHWVPVRLYQGPPIDTRTNQTWSGYPKLENGVPL